MRHHAVDVHVQMTHILLLTLFNFLGVLELLQVLHDIKKLATFMLHRPYALWLFELALLGVVLGRLQS
jgi:hypothetical protein